MQNQGLLKELIQSLCCLPGVGPKSAQRMAFHLLQRNRDGGMQLSKMLAKAVNEIGHCRECRTLTETELCEVCANPLRDSETLCVVESPADVWVIDQATTFKGKYFVLHGRLSPLDGIGPDQLGFELLEQRMAAGQIKEIILATNSTVEGQATAHFIGEVAGKFNIRATRIAHGVPMGGELEFIDSGTLAHAFNGRREF
ncbi:MULTISPECIES: recombination mediator RecR [Methylomonas]|jgi:recombination protein RecR|uniref:Recombination protein RecR n=2 Tax=Methylomonas TaxID=416 RepID=A0A177M7E5_METMH|nr:MULTISPECIES: recombination mediator RecR [Methylomonas]MCQ8119386.1 recombination mediator RecR [Methylomonas sp. WSC-7]OAI01612.1 recombination protein RecR [Methylomonas methanica]OAI08964.1 recombination protein RecR [Methylomonas methanica]